MKRFLSVLLCLALIALPLLLHCMPALAEGATIKAQWMPYEVTQFFSASQFNGWTIGASASYIIENTVGGTFFFVIAQKDGHNVLYGFEEKNGHYDYWMKTDNCLPQGKGGFIVRFNSGTAYFASGAAVTFGDGVSITFYREDDEEQADTALIAEVNKSGQFHVRAVFFNHAWDEAYLTSDSITYYLDEGHTKATVYGTVETDLRYFSLSAFPRTIKAAKEKLTQAPVIPSGELFAQKIKFTGGRKFPVYSGPGAEYERGAGGKASVSTNDWIQVFGSESGYIMIQYAISSSQMRIGYIDQSSLPKSASVSPLRFDWQDAEIIASAFLTDDPLNSQTRTKALNAGQQVKWLSTMGNWVYVEITGSGQPIRGFVPKSAIRQVRATETFEAAFQNGTYSANANVTVLRGVTAEITVTVSGPAAWKQENADPVARYEVYANNVPLNVLSSATRDLTASGWRTVFTLSATVPAGTTVLGLCPVHALSGQQAGEMITVVMNDNT